MVDIRQLSCPLHTWATRARRANQRPATTTQHNIMPTCLPPPYLPRHVRQLPVPHDHLRHVHLRFLARPKPGQRRRRRRHEQHRERFRSAGAGFIHCGVHAKALAGRRPPRPPYSRAPKTQERSTGSVDGRTTYVHSGHYRRLIPPATRQTEDSNSTSTSLSHGDAKGQQHQLNKSTRYTLYTTIVDGGREGHRQWLGEYTRRGVYRCMNNQAAELFATWLTVESAAGSS